MRAAHKALACWVGGAVIYNFLADDDETISQGVDELLAKYPLLTRAAIMTVAHHLANELLPHADPVELGFTALRRLRRRRLVVLMESEPVLHSAE